MISKLIVVCTGNICRSPIAEAALKARLPNSQVSSAGTGALVGYPADETALLVAKEAGFDMETHRARQATLAILSSADLVLTLDQSHSDWINRNYPQLRGRVHKLLRWQNNADVPDPYRKPRAAFDEAYKLIDGGVNDWIKRL